MGSTEFGIPESFQEHLMVRQSLSAASAAIALAAGGARTQTPALSPSTSSTLTYHSVTVDGIRIFYREAGPKDAPTLLLLHGYRSSSRMFDTLMALLADRYHLIAPDYPGFGQSDADGLGSVRPVLRRRQRGRLQGAVPDAEVHILDAGHFALDEKLDDIAALIRGFLFRQPPPFGTSN
jgi:pimeloyl-ACP methyl ester carboxylesterase